MPENASLWSGSLYLKGRGRLRGEAAFLVRGSDFEEHFEVFAGKGLPGVLSGNHSLGHATLHFLELDPEGTHIALGGDLDGCDQLTQGFDGVLGYQPLAQRLLERGLGEDTVMDIFWNNAIGVMERAVCNHKK